MPGPKHDLFAKRSNEELIALLHDADPASDDTNPERLKEEIVLRNVGLVKSIALKFLSSG